MLFHKLASKHSPTNCSSSKDFCLNVLIFAVFHDYRGKTKIKDLQISSPKVIVRCAFSNQVMNVHITGLSNPVHPVLSLNQDLNEINALHKCSGSTLTNNYIY